MTLRTLSNNLTKNECKRKIWLYIVTFFLLLLVKPARILMIIDNFLAWSMNYTVSDYVNNVLYYLKYSDSLNFVCNLALAVIYAYVSFVYLYSRPKVDLYHSLPISRSKMFRSFTFTAIVPYIIIETLITIILILEMGIKNLNYAYVIRIILSTYVYNLIFFVIFFSITAIAIFITGNKFVGLAMVVLLITGPEVIRSIFNDYISYCFQTELYGALNLSEYWILLMPATAVDNLGALLSSNLMLLGAIFIEAIVLLIVAAYVYAIRPSECTSQAICYEFLQPIIRIPSVIFAALSGGIYVVYVYGSLTASWYWSAFLVIAVIVHGLLSGIFYGDFRKIFKDWIQFIVSIVIAVVIAMFFLYDVFGYDRYIPNRDSIEYASISLYSIQSGISNYKLEEAFDGIELEYDDGCVYKLENMKIYDVDTVLELAQAGINNLNPARSVFERNKPRDVDSYEEDVYIDLNSYAIKYHLKNGRDIYRCYSADIDLTYDATKKIFDSMEYKNDIYQFEDIVNYGKIQKIEGTDPWGEVCFTLENDDISGLIYALKKDYMNLRMDDLRDSYPIANLSSILNKGYYNDVLYGYYIYPCCENALNFLAKKGYDLDKNYPKFDVDRINSIKVNQYRNSGSAEVVYESITDNEMIAELCDYMIPDMFSYENSVLKNYDYSISCSCSYTNDRGYLVEYGARMIRDQVPAKIYTDLESKLNGNEIN